ncbi:MAG: hypothetical protein KDB03_14540 [Planctomycetales bacterium]|nr:hypothetical protein [Planctomycetales bacterium]
MNSNPHNAPEAANAVDPEPVQVRVSSFQKIRNVARLLWLAPPVLAIPAFFAVREYVPDLNRGSIGDGFRKLNVFLGVVGTLLWVCWGSAFLLTCLHDVRLIPKSRLWTWLAVFVVLVLITIIVVACGA